MRCCEDLRLTRRLLDHVNRRLLAAPAPPGGGAAARGGGGGEGGEPEPDGAEQGPQG